MKFKEKDIVRITNEGNIYPSYREMFIQFKFRKLDINDLDKYYIPQLFKVLGIDKHRYEKQTIVAIESLDGKYQLLIDSDGITTVENT